MTAERRKEIKKMYLEYLSDIPVHKWACKYCRIDVKTSINWREEDKDFSNACEVKISEFVRRTAKRAKPEFQLERLLKDDFAQRTELTGKDGKDLKTVLVEFIKPDGESKDTNTS
jgi:hypothetical protein